MLPFTADQFLETFADYNNHVYPAQWALILAAFVAVVLSLTKNLSKLVTIILAFLWFWAGSIYHVVFFTRINGAAFFFGVLFLVQSLILIYLGAIRGSIRFQPRLNARGILGMSSIIFALILYPLLNDFLGHQYPHSPSFGVPCPVAIFTLGFLFWTERRAHFSVIAIPLLWTAIGASAVFLLGMYEDIGLLIAAITYYIFWLNDRR